MGILQYTTIVDERENAPDGGTDDPRLLPSRLRSALIGVMHVQRRHLGECAERHGMTAQQAISLFQLGESGDIPMRELAGRIGCDPSHLTGIADRLEELGLVERRPDAQDRRVKLLGVTDDGEQLRSSLIAEVDSTATGFAVLDTDEQRRLLALLERILDTGEDDRPE